MKMIIAGISLLAFSFCGSGDLSQSGKKDSDRAHQPNKESLNPTTKRSGLSFVPPETQKEPPFLALPAPPTTTEEKEPSSGLKTLAESGLPEIVYRRIANHPSKTTTPQQRDAIMAAVKAAITKTNQAERDKAIIDAVIKNGNDTFLGANVIRAVNVTKPLILNTNFVGLLLGPDEGSGKLNFSWGNMKLPSSFIVQIIKTNDPSKAKADDRVFLHPDNFLGKTLLNYGDKIYFNTISEPIYDDPKTGKKISVIHSPILGFHK